MKDPKDMTADELIMELTDGRGFTAEMESEAEDWHSASVGKRITAAILAIPEADRKAKTCAEATYAVLREMSAETGQNPDIETMFKGPEESGQYMGGTPGIYIVAWESGPYQWAIGASMEIPFFAEPYYSFDLCFYPADDPK